MPYVHGYGTWPFGEEWLWEVYATSYLPISALVDAGAPLTLSLTPVVADQLEAPAAATRCRTFLSEDRRRTHERDIEGLQLGGLHGELAASHHSWAEYDAAITRIDALDGDLLAPLARTSTWTSSATHAVLPLLATDAGIRLQVGTGAASHRRRTGRWRGGFWLPECAWDPELEAPLVEEGVRSICVELAGDHPARAPWETPDGLRILPIDRPLIDAIWHHTGYPSHADYRSSHARSYQGHALWANHGGAYDPEVGAARARTDARDWARRCADALTDGIPRIVAFDTELFGHWWHEGPTFLEAAIDALADAGVELLQADDLIARTGLTVDAAPPASTWGTGRDLRTWSAPKVATIAWELRRAELDLLMNRSGPSATGRVTDSALRDLLALQSSDWAFMVTEDRAASYGWARFAEHRRATTVPAGSLPSSAPRLRHLAPDLAHDALAVG
jgi:1,4-alpha-glucan branching enzyme